MKLNEIVNQENQILLHMDRFLPSFIVRGIITIITGMYLEDAM